MAGEFEVIGSTCFAEDYAAEAIVVGKFIEHVQTETVSVEALQRFDVLA
jgi:hypothetical protein